MKKILSFASKVPMLWLVLACGLAMGLLWRPHQVIAQWVVTILVAVSLIDTLRGMIDDVRHGHVGVDILAVVAILSTLAVKQYWASWAVVLMLYSGDAIEQYANNKAQGNLTLLVEAAPQVAHVVDGGGEARIDGHSLPEESDWKTVPVAQVALDDLLVVKPCLSTARWSAPRQPWTFRPSMGNPCPGSSTRVPRLCPVRSTVRAPS